MKVGIVGSRDYDNYQRIKEIIYKLKLRFGTDLIIVSGGCPNGADHLAKIIAKEDLQIEYVEFPPYHKPYNSDCRKNGIGSYMYGKAYSVRNFFARNKQIAEYSDAVIAFMKTGASNKGTQHTIDCAKKLNKKNMIIY